MTYLSKSKSVEIMKFFLKTSVPRILKEKGKINANSNLL